MFHVYVAQSWDEFSGCTGGSRWPLYLRCLIWVALKEAAGAAAGGLGGHGVGTSELPEAHQSRWTKSKASVVRGSFAESGLIA